MNLPPLAQLWDLALQQMRRRIGHQDVDIWLSSAALVRVDDHQATIELPNKYYVDWVEENYRNLLDEVMTDVSQQATRTTLVSRDDPSTGEAPLPTDLAQSNGLIPSHSVGVNPSQTFARFVVGACNQFAHAAAQAVANAPADAYNPLFIYGATGLGKTHLMHAIANEILARDPSARVIYVTAEDFMNEMINGIRYKRMEDFHARYRKMATVLLVDDIQFLASRDRTQEEFFHTFNALQASKRQIVLTADVLPEKIASLEPRLRTRFQGGLLADVGPPDQVHLLAILEQKAEHLGMRIPRDLAHAIASHVGNNIRELEGLLVRLAALQNFFNEPLTLDFARKRMSNVFHAAPITLTVKDIIAAVARVHNIAPGAITGDRRTRTFVRPRQVAMYLARKHTNLSFPELGREFGDRDHSTIQHGCRKVEQELPTNADVAHVIQVIEQTLGLR
jgi:chromosomal replication initiator protein